MTSRAVALSLLLAVPLTASAAEPKPAAKPAEAPAAAKPGEAKPGARLEVDLSGEKANAESTRFLSAVGHWLVVEEEGRKMLMVDGREWKKGQPAAGLAEKARNLYGAKHDEFVERVKAFAYFPITVLKDVEDFTDGEIAMRFKLVEGQLDQCAGILFDLKPNGDYLAVRYNAKDVNVVLWTFNDGLRKFVKKGTEDVALPMKTWHDLRIKVQGTQLEAFLDGKKYLDYTLGKPVSGKIGLWSKTDSVTLFDNYTVIPAKH